MNKKEYLDMIKMDKVFGIKSKLYYSGTRILMGNMCFNLKYVIGQYGNHYTSMEEFLEDIRIIKHSYSHNIPQNGITELINHEVDLAIQEVQNEQSKQR